jgi:putative transposase
MRLEGYDYSTPGAYFITICCEKKKLLFGTVCDGGVLLNSLGEIASAELPGIGQHHNAHVDTFIVMPSHVHAVVFLDPALIHESLRVPGGPRAAPTGALRDPPALGTVVGMYKQAVSRAVRRVVGDPKLVVWQRGYYEHVIRDEDDLSTRRQYILDNPIR